MLTAIIGLALQHQAVFATSPSDRGVEAGGEPTAVNTRHDHVGRPAAAQPQYPAPSTPQNVDMGRPFWQWQHLSDDWFGLRPVADDAGIIFDGLATLDGTSNFCGGTKRGSVFRYLVDTNLTVDLQRLAGWTGGTLFLDFYHHDGRDGSTLLVGDLQGISNIDGPHRTQLAELWYEQVVWDGVFRVKFGKIEANSEFAYSDGAAEFIHSSAGVSPTILGLPTYPDPAMGAVLFASPCDNFYAGVGLFDGAAQEGVPTGARGPVTFFGTPADLFAIGEIGVTWAGQNLPGRLAVGAWGHTGTFARFDGSNQSGTSGPYVVLDQMLWRPGGDDDDPRGLGLFLQYGYANPQVSAIEHHLGAGLAWTGLIPARDGDVTGAMTSWARLTDEGGAGFTDRYELAIECFYKVQVTPFLSVKPDLQYIIHPGGAGANDALVGTLRAEIEF